MICVKKLGFTTSKTSLGTAVAKVTYVSILNGFCLQKNSPEKFTGCSLLEKSPASFCPSASHRSELGADAGDHFITTPSHTPLAHQPLVGSGRAAPERRDARAVVESAAAAAAAAGGSSGAPPARVRARAVLRGGSV